jgi:hypothetical protein
MISTPLITPHTRGQMQKKIQQNKPWKGTRGGVRIEIQHATQLNFSKNRIEWRARIEKEWISGHSPTVWDAVQEIEAEAHSAARRIAAETLRCKLC